MIDTSDIDRRICEKLDGYSPLTHSEISDALCDDLGRPMRYNDMLPLVAVRLEALTSSGIVLVTHHPEAAMTFYYSRRFEALARSSE